ncbi:MAG: SDR family oxidoreductase [Gemmatimonadaceae bacterium]
MLSLITGIGARGQVGEAVGSALAARGDVVLLAARTEQNAMDRAAEITALGHRAHGYACDLSSESQVATLARRVRDEHGDRLDALVNLAGGFGKSGPMDASLLAALERMLAINLTTAYLTTRAFLPMLRSASGSIVYFASDTVLEGSGTKGISGYVASKAAVVALMRSVADEERQTGVRANALAPGSIRTAANVAAMGQDVRYIERAQVASAVAFLCSPGAQAITGQTIRLRA